MKIYYPGQRGGPFGWGQFGQHVTKHLDDMGLLTYWPAAADVCLMPIADHDFNPATEHRAKINCGVTFFESELGPNAAANAEKYDIVFVGSTWCKERCAERGIHNTEVLIQGVDQSIFYPRPRKPDGQFRIFSGGKFEYRKGQDLVIAAFREFSKSHPDAHLVCSWFNPWPQLITSDLWRMDIKTHVRAETQWEFFASLLALNDIPRDRFTILGMLDHIDLAEEMAQTDCGLFPNRCEGGTNLVLMEYAACGRPPIANLKTGHRDISDWIPFLLHSDEDDDTGWAIDEVSDIVHCLGSAHRMEAKLKQPFPFTWEQSAQTVANAIERLAVAV